MPASEIYYGLAHSFFEEYAATPVKAGHFCVVKKVGTGRILSIKNRFSLSVNCLPAKVTCYQATHSNLDQIQIPFLFPVQRTASLVFNDTSLEEIAFLLQVDHLTHPRKRIFLVREERL